MASSLPTSIVARENDGSVPVGPPTPKILWWSARHPPADPQVSFAGRTVLVTGANAGLGFEAAVKYAKLGASRLLLGVRSKDKGLAAKARIVEQTGIRGDAVSVLLVDLLRFSSVQKFVDEVNQTVDHLDVVLLNAGLASPTYKTSPEGYELAVQVNVLSTALMALLLLPKLRATAAAGRTVHVSFTNSIGHVNAKAAEWQGSTLLRAANDKASWTDQNSYMRVKLLGIVVMKVVAALAPRGLPDIAPGAAGGQIIVNASCPSMCKTEIGRDFGFVAKVMMVPFQAMFARTAEEGSRTLVGATALGPESQGGFWSHDCLYLVNELLEDASFVEETWKDILDDLDQHVPGASKLASI
ncbi:hypothetical protein PG985_014063 [Apiospora marii]|uniref:Uncharacterized protein n=1 Tax=Apiospora marii TaxID=335849 RepID=A0ABR1R622_9PEZI